MKNKNYMVMLFYSERELGISERGDVFINTRNIFCGNDSFKALDIYSNTLCPASQIIEASTMKELAEKKQAMIENFNNKEWVKNLMEYI